MNKSAIFEQVSSIMTDYLQLEAGEINEQSHAVTDLGADSLALVELGFKFMEAFGVGMIEPKDELLIIGNLVAHIASEMES